MDKEALRINLVTLLLAGADTRMSNIDKAKVFVAVYQKILDAFDSHK